mmetsp:Transcript_51621/g.122986  ORF Transcript_51621/g.122986 Transcript_51621/m.122986 type:complete len:274 (+) Transcript_51621:1525-2346(+)
MRPREPHRLVRTRLIARGVRLLHAPLRLRLVPLLLLILLDVRLLLLDLGTHRFEVLDIRRYLLLLTHVDACAEPAAEEELGLVLLVVQRVRVRARVLGSLPVEREAELVRHLDHLLLDLPLSQVPRFHLLHFLLGDDRPRAVVGRLRGGFALPVTLALQDPLPVPRPLPLAVAVAARTVALGAHLVHQLIAVALGIILLLDLLLALLLQPVQRLLLALRLGQEGRLRGALLGVFEPFELVLQRNWLHRLALGLGRPHFSIDEVRVHGARRELD